MRPDGSPYAALGVATIVNADTTLTDLGSPRVDPRVVEAMAAASKDYVDMHELQRRAGERLAQLTRNEAAVVTAGAAAGLTLATLALHELRAADFAGEVPTVVVQAPHANPYLAAVRLGGAEVALAGVAGAVTEQQIADALARGPLGLLHVVNGDWQQGALPFATVLAHAREAGVPVIVDAAAQLPPVEQLWAYTTAGADLALFSGGKGLAGPAGAGLAVGRPALVATIARLAAPNHGPGRGFKLSKEEIVGLLTAVELFLDRDHDAERARIEAITDAWVEQLGQLPHVEARRVFPGEAGRPHPRAQVTLGAAIALDAAAARRALLAGDPPVAVAVGGDRDLLLNAECLARGEESVVLDAVAAIVHAHVQEVAP
jgi:L-seryl-tRNA(Ser) seleniumtransferase